MIIGLLYALLILVSGIYVYKQDDDEGGWFKNFCVFFIIAFAAIYTLQYFCTERYYINEKQNFTFPVFTVNVISDNDRCRVVAKNMGVRFISEESKVNVYTVDKEEEEIVEIIGQYRTFYPANPVLSALYYGSKDDQYNTEYIVDRINISVTKEHRDEITIKPDDKR